MVLITGATGLIGHHLLKELVLHNKPIRCLYNNTKPSFEHPNIEWVFGNITDIESLIQPFVGIEYVYHCAAMVSFDSALTNAILDTNVEGTKNVVNLSLKNNIKKLIYISSVATLNKKNIRDNDVLFENNILENPAQENIYAYSKFLAELEVWRGIEEGLSANMVLPSIVLGAGNWNNSSIALFKQTYHEFPFYTSGANGFVDVQDVVNACILLMNADFSGEKFILNGSNKSWLEITSEIATEFGKRKPFIYFPKTCVPVFLFINYIFTRIKGKKNPLTKDIVYTTYKRIAYSNQKFLSQFPSFEFTDISISIQRVCAELKSIFQLSKK